MTCLSCHDRMSLSDLLVEKNRDTIWLRQMKAMQINEKLISNEQQVHVIGSRTAKSTKKIEQGHSWLIHDKGANGGNCFRTHRGPCPNQIFFEKAEILKVHRVCF